MRKQHQTGKQNKSKRRKNAEYLAGKFLKGKKELEPKNDTIL